MSDEGSSDSGEDRIDRRAALKAAGVGAAMLSAAPLLASQARAPRVEASPACRTTGSGGPGHIFYKPAVHDALNRGSRAEIEALIRGAREVQAEYRDFPRLIARLEEAARRAR